MNNNRLDLNLLRVLHAVYAERSVTAAAFRLHLSQPAVSHALRRLRESLEDPLFVRQGSYLVPTAYTRSVIAPTQAALQALERSLDRSTEFDEKRVKRRFVIGIHDALEMYALPKVVAYLTANAPHIDVTSLSIDAASLESDLATGILDAAVDFAHPLSKDLRTRAIASDELAVLCHKGHPIAKSGVLKLKQYLAAEHVVVSAHRDGVTVEDAELARRGLSRIVRARTQRYVSAMEIVARSDLLLTMPRSYARVVNSVAQNAIFQLPFAAPKLAHHLYWHKLTEDDPSNLWIRSLIEKAFE